MSERNNGGPAFPQPQAPYDQSTFCGVSVRDYFAAKAMQGLLAQSMGTALGSDPKYAAEYAYATADAMLAERSK